jgi:hypothetical protein
MEMPNGLHVFIGDVWSFMPKDNSPVSKAGHILVLEFCPQIDDPRSEGEIKVYHLERQAIDYYGFRGPHKFYNLVSRL